MDQPPAEASPARTVETLGREFFAALDARDPRRLRATLANHATFRALPHTDVVRPADEIVAYFGTVVSSYPTARWEVTDVIAAEIAMYIRLGSSGSTWIEWQHMPPAPGCHWSRVGCSSSPWFGSHVMPPSPERKSTPGAPPSHSVSGSLS